jgi:chromosome segregation ATPase
MWPKVIAQLFELLPHITRLVPMADKYLSSKTASEKATEAAMAAMAEGVRGDLGQVTKAHAGLYRQLQDQSAQIAEVGEEVKRARLSVEQHENRMVALESSVASLQWWIKGGVSLLVVLAGVVIGLLVRLMHSH